MAPLTATTGSHLWYQLNTKKEKKEKPPPPIKYKIKKREAFHALYQHPMKVESVGYGLKPTHCYGINYLGYKPEIIMV